MTKPDIKALSRLARIDLSAEEETVLVADSEKILAFVEAIQKVHGGTETGTLQPGTPMNVFRDDVNPHEKGIYTEAILSQAPARDGNYVKVKKIL
jgi:aspartyl/glutamyl-tRNA(Asn/Gln) amidotransferase C subunit